MSPSDDAVRSQYLSFDLDGVEYGIGILGLKEILQYETVTPVPSMPASIRGVINLRGSVVPVIDLAAKLGKGVAAVTQRTCILIVETRLDGQPTVMGLMADAVREVVEFGPGDIEPPPTLGARVRVEYLTGLGKAGPRRFVLLLDVEKVVEADERALADRPVEFEGTVEPRFEAASASPAESEPA